MLYLATRGINCSRAIKNLIWREGVFYIQLTHKTQNSCRSIKQDEPWRPPSYHGRHGDPLPAPMRRNISQQAMQQRDIVKTRTSYHKYYLFTYFQPLQRLCPRKTTHKTLTKSAARRTSQPWRPPSSHHGRLGAPQTSPSIEKTANTIGHRLCSWRTR
jgi:hypothetical protein